MELKYNLSFKKEKKKVIGKKIVIIKICGL